MNFKSRYMMKGQRRAVSGTSQPSAIANTPSHHQERVSAWQAAIPHIQKDTDEFRQGTCNIRTCTRDVPAGISQIPLTSGPCDCGRTIVCYTTPAPVTLSLATPSPLISCHYLSPLILLLYICNPAPPGTSVSVGFYAFQCWSVQTPLRDVLDYHILLKYTAELSTAVLLCPVPLSLTAI
ncbi:hypothetical protein CBL_05443 [Carabus blaptoides fortunei]